MKLTRPSKVVTSSPGFMVRPPLKRTSLQPLAALVLLIAVTAVVNCWVAGALFLEFIEGVL